MPSMSGIKATSCLRESWVTKDTPVIICTAWTAEKHREAALQSGACSDGIDLNPKYCRKSAASLSMR